MKTILIILISINLFANIKEDLFNLYQNQKYEEVCNIGFKNFSDYRNDEEYISLYAFACLKSDYLDRIAVPLTKLKFSKEARANASYLSVILMQKKLLYHALVDNYDLSSFDLPTTNYVLSKVFDFYSKLGKHQARTFYIFEDTNDKKLTYKLYILKDDKLNKIVIEEFYDTILIKKHIYW